MRCKTCGYEQKAPGNRCIRCGAILRPDCRECSGCDLACVARRAQSARRTNDGRRGA